MQAAYFLYLAIEVVVVTIVADAVVVLKSDWKLTSEKMRIPSQSNKYVFENEFCGRRCDTSLAPCKLSNNTQQYFTIDNSRNNVFIYE